MGDYISEKMHEPLNEADIKESIGLVYANLMFLSESPRPKYKIKDFYKPMLNSVEIRKELFGPYNK